MTASTPAEDRGQWWRFVLVLVVTTLMVLPIVAVVVLSFQPRLGSTVTGATVESYIHIFTETNVALWLRNSVVVAAATVVATVVLAAPAGYVLSRGRGRLVSGFSLTLFIIQALPAVTAIIPLFVLFAAMGLVDTLSGVIIIHVGNAVAVATWMMAAYYDTIPIDLEEAAWIDGASIFGSFTRVVLRNSLPGLLSTAIFTFLVAWNDYLVAIVFLRSDRNFTFALGLESFFQQNITDWGPVAACAVVMMLPPVLVFAVLNRYFSLGGIGGSLAGR